MTTVRTHLLVCAGTGCVSCGAFGIRSGLEAEVRRRGLGGEVEVVATGCNGFCERGPIVVVQPDGVFYQRLAPADIPELVEEHLIKGRPVRRLMYVPPEEREPVPRMKDIPFFKHQRLIVLRNRGRIDPERIDDYIAADGYEAAAKALGEMTLAPGPCPSRCSPCARRFPAPSSRAGSSSATPSGSGRASSGWPTHRRSGPAFTSGRRTWPP